MATVEACDKAANDTQAVITRQTTDDCKTEARFVALLNPNLLHRLPVQAGPAPAQANSYGFPDLLQGAKIPELVNRLVYATLSVGRVIFRDVSLGRVMYLTAGGTADRVKRRRRL